MPNKIDNLVLEHLRSLRNDLAGFRHDTMERLDNLTARVASMGDQLAGIRADIARLDHRLEGVDKRVERIERRLTLAESPG